MGFFVPQERSHVALVAGLVRFDYWSKTNLTDQKLHGKYGNCFRIAPNEISYINAEAWHDICGTEQPLCGWRPKSLTAF